MKLKAFNSSPNEMWISIFNVRDATIARMARTTPPEMHMIRGKKESSHTQQHQRIQQMISHMPAKIATAYIQRNYIPTNILGPPGHGCSNCVRVCVRLQLQNL